MFKRKLLRDVTAVLVFKVVALTVLFFLFFSPSHRERVDIRTLFDTPPSTGISR